MATNHVTRTILLTMGFVAAAIVLFTAASSLQGGSADVQWWEVALGLALIYGLISIILLPIFICVLHRPFSRGAVRVAHWLISHVGSRRDFNRGQLMLAAGKVAEAEHLLDKYAATHPRDPSSKVGLAQLRLTRYDPVAAAEFIQQSLAMERTPHGLVVRAVVRMNVGDADGALDDVDECLAMEKRNVGAQVIGALALINLRLLTGAANALKRVRKRFSHPSVTLYLAETYRLLGRGDEATKMFQETIALAPTCIQPHHNHDDIVAYCLTILGQLDEARLAIQSALGRYPDNEFAISAKALVHQKDGDLDAVESALRLLPPHQRVSALTDPQFTPLLASDRFKSLLAEALDERGRLREQVMALIEDRGTIGAGGQG